MLQIHQDDSRLSRVRVAFEDGALSFMLQKDATFEDLADRMDRLGERHYGKPVAIEVKLAAASARIDANTSRDLVAVVVSAHRHRGTPDLVSEPPVGTGRAQHLKRPTREGSDGQGPEKIEPGS